MKKLKTGLSEPSGKKEGDIFHVGFYEGYRNRTKKNAEF